MFICHVRIVNDCLLAVYFQYLLGRPNLAMFEHVLNESFKNIFLPRLGCIYCFSEGFKELFGSLTFISKPD